jgi:N-carbamoylputrescine amidase
VHSLDHWQRAQQGHAAANLVPLIASNRIGLERSLQSPEELYIRFYGSSFIADAQGKKIAEADEESECVVLAQFDLAAIAELRDNWFVFRDRRPELYGALTSLDGSESAAYRHT